MHRNPRPVHLRLETLEDRAMPSIDVQGGNIVIQGLAGNVSDNVTIFDGMEKGVQGYVVQNLWKKGGKAGVEKKFIPLSQVTGDRITFHGGDGDDSFQYVSSYTKTLKVFAYGEAGNDVLKGFREADELYGGSGSDELWGYAGDVFDQENDKGDYLVGGDDNDANDLKDVLHGGYGDDTLDGGNGADLLYGEQGNDDLDGGKGIDYLNGGENYDELYADRGGESLLNGEHVEITLGQVNPQNDSWSCGANSGARVLRSYGYNVTYEQLRQRVTQVWPGANDLLQQTRVGPPPAFLAKAMQQWKKNTTSQTQTNFNALLQILGGGKPIVALIQPGLQYVDPTHVIPLLHYVALRGFDLASQELYYTDTNGAEATMSFAAFKEQWDWSVNVATKTALAAAGVWARSFVF